MPTRVEVCPEAFSDVGSTPTASTTLRAPRPEDGSRALRSVESTPLLRSGGVLATSSLARAGGAAPRGDFVARASSTVLRAAAEKLAAVIAAD